MAGKLGLEPRLMESKSTLLPLEDFPFDLFDDIIDHSYDNEINPTKRIFMAVKQLEKISETNKKFTELDYHKLYFNIFPRYSIIDNGIMNAKISHAKPKNYKLYRNTRNDTIVPLSAIKVIKI